MAELIQKQDTLNEGRVKINAAITDAEQAKVTADGADSKATQALANSESTQTQLDTIVINGDSSVEAAQARVDEKGVWHTTLKDRIDDGFTEVTSQLAQIAINVLNPGNELSPAKGDSSDDTENLQNIFDFAISNGHNVYIPKPSSYYKVRNDIIIDGAENMNIYIDKDALFKTADGNHDGIKLYPDDPNGPIHRTFFTLKNSDRVVLSGGHFDCSGFEHPGDGRSASAILVIESNNVTVANTKVTDLKPSGVWQLVTDVINGKNRGLQYIGILGVKTKGLTIKNNYAHTIAYSAYEAKIGCEDTKFLGNYAENCGEHGIQPSPTYVDTEIKTADKYNRGVLIAHNTCRGETTDITIHAQNVVIDSNTLIDTTRRVFSFRNNSDGILCINNVAYCVIKKGSTVFQIDGSATEMFAQGNLFRNFEKVMSGESTRYLDLYNNNFISVNDVRGNTNYGNKSSSLLSGINNSSFGFEAGMNSNGDKHSIFGWRSGLNANSEELTAMGAEAAAHNKGERITAVGSKALYDNGALNEIVAIGESSGYKNKGARSTFIGTKSGSGNSGDDALLIGRNTGISNTHDNVTGLNANPTAPNQIAIGDKHIELKYTNEPSAPVNGARIWVTDSGLFIKFPNGQRVKIADIE